MSFAGHIVKVGPGASPADYACEWTFQLADIEGTAFDGTTFRGGSCRDVVVWAAGNPAGPEAAMRIVVIGTLDRVPGYSMVINAVDQATSGATDQIRFRLYAGSDPVADPSGLLYDSDAEFSSDVQRRTYVDAGNLQSWVDAPLP